MKRAAIITARGGSKRIPRKNIKLFLGKPILHYSIEAALASGIFEEVMVSTEDVQIADIAKEAGAKVPFYRSNEAADDYATTADVIMDVLDMYERHGRCFDSVCCIYPTAPFVTAGTLREAMSLLEDEGAECVLPVVRYSFPPQRSVVIKDKKVAPRWPECMNMRSQDLDPLYHDAGQFYCLDVPAFRRDKKVVMKHTLPFILPEISVQDIDSEEDWEIAELKYRLLHDK